MLKLQKSQICQIYCWKADSKTFRMSIYMLNKIWTDREIFGSKVDIYDTKKMHVIPKVFTLKASSRNVEGSKEFHGVVFS